MSFVSSKGNILCRLIKIELYKIFAIINRAIKGLHCIKMTSCQYRKSHCGDKMTIRSSISTMGFPILIKLYLHIESAPRCLSHPRIISDCVLSFRVKNLSDPINHSSVCVYACMCVRWWRYTMITILNLIANHIQMKLEWDWSGLIWYQHVLTFFLNDHGIHLFISVICLIWIWFLLKLHYSSVLYH